MEAAAQALAPNNEPVPATYHENRIPQTEIRVWLNSEVLDHLSADVMEGFKAVPRRGLEVGGLLVGRTAGDEIVIDQVIAIASEHRHGPSWLLSEKDREALTEAATEANQNPDGTRVVGLYRSQTRAGTSPAAEDEALLQECTGFGARIFLLIKPEAGQPSAGRLFATGEGLRKDPAEFALYRAMPGARALPEGLVPALASPSASQPVATPALPHPPRLSSVRVKEALALQLERSQATRMDLPSSAVRLEEELEPEEKPEALSRPQPRFTWAWAAGVLICAGLSGYGLARWWSVRPHVVSRPERPMALNVIWAGGSLHLSWDRESPAIRRANRAIVWIGDGAQQRRLDLDARELTEGSIQYWPSSSDVGFKLEVFGPDSNVSESVRAINVPRQSGAEPARPGAPESRSDEPPSAPRPGPERADLTQPSPGSALAVRGSRPPFAKVSLEVVKQTPRSAQGKAAARRYAMTEPPKPLHQEIPMGAPGMRNLEQEVQVDVKLDLDPLGKVTKAELVSKHTGSGREFDHLALNASRRWTFAPARSGQRRILSKVILHYRFGEPTLAEARR
jgi:TonB family protein